MGLHNANQAPTVPISILLLLFLILLGMQNLSISCSLVCLIILVACLLVFWIGLIERQVPPVLVVSVLYLLAGTNYNILYIYYGKGKRKGTK